MSSRDSNASESPRDRPIARLSDLALQDFLASDDEWSETGAAATAAEARVELLVFGLGSENYALRVALLREIVRPPPLSEVPRAAAWIMGVTMIRGEVVPVYDPRGRLGVAGPPTLMASSRVVVAAVPQGSVGLWVDVVRSVVRLPGSELESPPLGIGNEAGAVERLGRVAGKLFAVINLPALIGAEPPSTS